MSIGLIIAIIVAILPFVDRIQMRIIASGMINDDFAIAALQANGPGGPCGKGWYHYYYLRDSAFRNLLRKKPLLYFVYMPSHPCFILFSILLYTPKIERYSQNALIEFCKKNAGKMFHWKL